MDKYVTYEQFGAVGDGVTEDFAAIYAAHEYANANGLTVKAKEGAHYYIHDTHVDGEVREAVIKTDVDWGGARFTIDDRDISTFSTDATYDMHAKFIFRVMPDFEKEIIVDRTLLDKLVADGFGKSTKKLDLHFDYPVMIIPYNSKHKVYRRCGYAMFMGKIMHEVIVLDRDGNVDKDTPFMFDYNNIDYIEVYRLDGKHVTVCGGEFTTRASRVNCVVPDENGNPVSKDSYLFRSLGVQRSFTTVKNVKHYVTDEITLNDQVKDGKIVRTANSYNGFFAAANANEVTFDGCVLTGRRCYRRPQDGTQGTYDLTANNVNKIYFKNCTQSNFWVKLDENNIITPAKEGDAGALPSMTWVDVDGIKLKMHWGLGGTNFCKNMEYHNSTLSRFDAHEGLYSGKIINCTVNYMAITGKGDFIVENTRWFSEGPDYNANSLIHLREDYGSTWEGKITMKNIKAYVYSSAPVYLCMHRYRNWYYGYKTYYPSISVDGVDFYDINTRKPLPAGYEVAISDVHYIKTEPALHLPETLNTHPLYADVDYDGDGLVDGTNIPYDNGARRAGVADPSSYKNLNPNTPPAVIEIKGNGKALKDGKVRLVVFDTANYKGVTDGGFFGKTKFITDGASYTGTDYVGQDTETFKFVAIE